MNHRKVGRKFGRVRRQRKALLTGLLSSLVIHGKIRTTEAKAKELRSHAERLITRVRRAKDDRRRIAMTIDPLLPVVSRKVVMGEEFRARCAKRSSGFTRVVKLPARISDGAKMAVIEFVD